MGKGSDASGARGGGAAGGGAASGVKGQKTVADLMDQDSREELFGTMSQRTSADNLLNSSDNRESAYRKMNGAIADLESDVNGRYQKALDSAKALPKGYPGRSAEIRRAEANLSTARADLEAMKEVRSAIASGTKISVYTDASNKLHVRR